MGSIPTRSRQFRGARGPGVVRAAAGLLLATLGVAVDARAQVDTTVVPDARALVDSSVVASPIVPIDSLDVYFDAADSAAAAAADDGSGRRGAGDEPRIRRIQEPPSLALTTLKSGLVPGWGQWTNGKRVKALVVFGVWGTFATQAVLAEQDRKDAARALGDSGDPALEALVNDAVERRNSRMWLMGAVSVFAMLDAYVDAHFWNFDDEWSARVAPGPQGLPVLAIRWRF